MLPENNIPVMKNQGNQQQLDANPAKNFGSFEVLVTTGLVDHGLKVENFPDVYGYENEPLGLGVITTVMHFFLLASHCFLFCHWVFFSFFCFFGLY